MFIKIQFKHHSYGNHKAEVTAARLDKYIKYRASPAVLSEERIRDFCTSLELHEGTPLFTAIMLGSDCDPLPALSPSFTSMSTQW